MALIDTLRSNDYFRAVKVVIELSLGLYDGFVDKCDPTSREYVLLKNGIVIRRPKADHFERIMEVHCDFQEAKELLDLARRIYPDAVPDIEKAIAAPRDS
jgi:hypothetical protein